MRRFSFRLVPFLVLACVISQAAPQPAYGQQKARGRSVTRPSVWHNPGLVHRLDFAGGPGGSRNAPKPPFTFIEEDTGGSNPKIKVSDATGRTWSIKWGSEVNAEVFASRLVWAAGYYVEPSYYVRSGRILRVTKLDRAKKFVDPDGRFTDARFELKEKGIDKLEDEDSWRWDKNPFVGTRELNGLKIVMMLTSNWDSKDQRDEDRGSNTAIFKIKRSGEVRYVVTDWGGTMGKWGNYFTREKWDCEEFTDQNKKFIDEVENGFVEFGYSGQRTDDIKKGISKRDVSWLLRFIGRVSDAQLRAGLKASGANDDEVRCFTSAIRNRINQLRDAAVGR